MVWVEAIETMTDPETRAVRSPVAGVASAGNYVCDVVAWEFADNDGFSAPRDAVKAIFAKNGFGKCIDGGQMDPGLAILRSRTAGGVRKGHGIVVEPMEAPNKDTPAALGVYLKKTEAGEVGDEFPCGARVRIDPTTNLAVALPPEGATAADPKCLAVAEQLANKTNELIGQVRNKELSAALTCAGDTLYWARFRSAGGTYVVYHPHATRFRALLDELETFGNFHGTIQPLFADGDGRTIKNVTRASENDLLARLKELTDTLAKARAQGLRADAVARQVDECEDLLIRAQLFRAVLREAADGITKQVEEIRTAFGNEDFARRTGDATEFEAVKELAPKVAPKVETPKVAAPPAPAPAPAREPSVDDDPSELFSV